MCQHFKIKDSLVHSVCSVCFQCALLREVWYYKVLVKLVVILHDAV